MPDLRGRTAVVTGANTGLGFQTARLLARHGATVVLACRNPAKATAAAEQIRAAVPAAKPRTIELDLAALDSVRAAASWLQAEYPHLDLLINNAGGSTRGTAAARTGSSEPWPPTTSARSRSPGWCWICCSPRRPPGS